MIVGGNATALETGWQWLMRLTTGSGSPVINRFSEAHYAQRAIRLPTPRERPMPWACLRPLRDRPERDNPARLRYSPARPARSAKPGPEQIVDPLIRGWVNPAVLRRLDLCPAPLFHEGRYLPHQFGPRPQVCRLPRRIRNRVPDAVVAFRFLRFPPLVSSANLLLMVSMSRFEVACVFF